MWGQTKLKYFDAYLAAQTSPKPPQGELAGAVLYGPGAAACRDALANSPESPGNIWRCAGKLEHVVGAEDSRYPHADIVDLHLSDVELIERLKDAGTGDPRKPCPKWWPLLSAIARQKRFLRIEMPPGTPAAKGVRVLALQFPQTRFILDVFTHGLTGGWQAQVRLAECKNVWVTTRGLYPGSTAAVVGSEALDDAMYFVGGEVGASKLLFASGLNVANLPLAPSPAEWLAGIETLDDAQRELILHVNAEEIFSGG